MDDGRLWPLFALGVAGLALGAYPLWWIVKRVGRHVGGVPQAPVNGSSYVAALVLGILLFAVGSSALSMLVMLQGWRSFTKKTHVAEVQCIEVAAHKLRLYLVPIDRDGARGATEVYDLDGDQWEVGGDVLRFKSFVTAFGVQPVFRLNRVEGRWTNAADASAHNGSAYDRTPPGGAWLSLYRRADRAPMRWLVAGAHGQYVSQLPDRRAMYDIFVTPNGYVVDKRSL